jgi:hypothetical protein
LQAYESFSQVAHLVNGQGCEDTAERISVLLSRLVEYRVVIAVLVFLIKPSRSGICAHGGRAAAGQLGTKHRHAPQALRFGINVLICHGSLFARSAFGPHRSRPARAAERSSAYYKKARSRHTS